MSHVHASLNVEMSSCPGNLQASFDAAMAQKQALEDDATATQRKMDSANALINALAGEESRWTQQSKEFDDTIQRLTGRVVVQQVCVSRRDLRGGYSLLVQYVRQLHPAACCWMCHADSRDVSCRYAHGTLLWWKL